MNFIGKSPAAQSPPTENAPMNKELYAFLVRRVRSMRMTTFSSVSSTRLARTYRIIGTTETPKRNNAFKRHDSGRSLKSASKRGLPYGAQRYQAQRRAERAKRAARANARAASPLQHHVRRRAKSSASSCPTA